MAGRKMMSVEAILANGNKGHFTAEEIEKRKSQEEELKKLSADKIRPPTWLGKEAKKIFKTIVKELEVIDLLANIDIYVLAILADAMSKYIECTISLHADDLTIEYTNKKGHTNLIENPIVKTQLKYGEVVRKISSDMGLTPAARLKIIQQHAPEIDDEEREFREDFNDV